MIARIYHLDDFRPHPITMHRLPADMTSLVPMGWRINDSLTLDAAGTRRVAEVCYELLQLPGRHAVAGLIVEKQPGKLFVVSRYPWTVRLNRVQFTVFAERLARRVGEVECREVMR